MASDPEKLHLQELESSLAASASSSVDPVELLRSRVDQQSQLIAMLKQRGDRTIEELEGCREKCEQATKDRDRLERRLLEAEEKRETIEKRFHNLAENHQEMIRIKDEYKQENAKLRKDVQKVKAEKGDSVRGILDQRDREIARLRDLLQQTSKELTSLEQKFKSRESALLEDKSSCELKIFALEKSLLNTQNDLKELQMKQPDLEQKNSARSAEVEELKGLLRDKEDSIKLKETELKGASSMKMHLQSKLDAALDKIQEMKQDFQTRMEEVSKDVCVRRLRTTVQEQELTIQALEVEFTAYKNHSSELLKQERHLNEKLRHFS